MGYLQLSTVLVNNIMRNLQLNSVGKQHNGVLAVNYCVGKQHNAVLSIKYCVGKQHNGVLVVKYCW
jgi:hypothetical protein